MEMETTIDRLREMTPHLPSVPTLDDLVEFNNGKYQIHFKHGRVYKQGEEITALLNIPEVAVALVEGTQGDTLTTHKHDAEKEYMVVFRGRLRVVSSCLTTDLGAGDHIMIERRLPHKLIALTDVSYIAITIPASKHYPANDTT